MKKLMIFSILFFSSLLLAGPQNQMQFNNFDTNSDGMINEEEFTTTQSNNMAKMAEEGRPMRNAGNAPSFNNFDLDKDGKVTQNEFSKTQMERRKTMMQQRNPKAKGYGQRKGN